VEGQASKTRRGSEPYVTVPWHVLAVALLWLVLIVASFTVYQRNDAFADFVTFELGRLPFEVIWFGAVGGWLISAQGIFDHNREWLRSYDYWHYLRPVLGAIIGTLGCLIFIVLNDAATSREVAPNAIFYDVIALGIGYRESSFRSLLSSVFDTIILPGNKGEKKTEPAEPQP
jgi:tellurite resistance protein TehA-like permease